jgi:serine/threonine protein phosphatase PrpC
MAAPLSLQVALLSEQGGRSYNEDACGHWRSDEQLCCVLADGAGGHGGGDIASKLAVQDLVGRFSASPTQDGAALAVLLRQTNEALREQRTPDTTRQDMHSTVVCLVIDFVAHRAHWAHVGDSRMYWLRDGKVLRRTSDHSLVQALVDAGMLSEDAVRTHPKRSELCSALGLEPEALEVSQGGGTDEVEPGDVFLLCTDGLWEYVDDAVLAGSLSVSGSPQAWLDSLAAEVRRNAAHKPSHDNYTALAIWADAS